MCCRLQKGMAHLVPSPLSLLLTLFTGGQHHHEAVVIQCIQVHLCTFDLASAIPTLHPPPSFTSPLPTPEDRHKLNPQIPTTRVSHLRIRHPQFISNDRRRNSPQLLKRALLSCPPRRGSQLPIPDHHKTRLRLVINNMVMSRLTVIHPCLPYFTKQPTTK